jgi:nitrite reductase/ring-hydroxylating ferredoxin subunit
LASTGGGPVAVVLYLILACCMPALAEAANHPPTISGTPATIAYVGKYYVFRPKAADADGNTLRFSIRNKPGWATFDATTGRLSGTPRSGDVATYGNIGISVTDGIATTRLAPFSITVKGNTAPTISGAPKATAVVGKSYSFRPSAYDADGNALKFSIRNKPVWANFDPLTGRLYGTPASSHVGTYASISIGVSDGIVTRRLPLFSITVRTNVAPKISGVPATTAAPGVAYAFAPVASDADGDALRFNIRNKPAWATFDPASGRLRGTPSSAQAGTYSNISIGVSDGFVTTRLPAFSITVGGATDRTVRLSWSPPTLNTDGSPLTDLAEFRVFYGQVSGRYDYSLRTGSPTITAMEIQGLTPGTWYFSVKAVTSRGVESDFSREANKTLL